MTLLHQAAQKAVEAVPRFRWDQDMDVLAGPYPDGEWVRRADVIAALQQQPEPAAWRTEIWNAAVAACSLLVQPIPHVDEERTCGEVASAIRKLLMDTAPPALQRQEVPAAVRDAHGNIVLHNGREVCYRDEAPPTALHQEVPREPVAPPNSLRTWDEFALRVGNLEYIAKRTTRQQEVATWLLYEHEDGHHAVAPTAEAATFAHGDPAWHRVGPVEVSSASRPYRSAAGDTLASIALVELRDANRWPEILSLNTHVLDGAAGPGSKPRAGTLLTLPSPSTTQQQEAPAYLSPEACKQFAEHATRQQEVGSGDEWKQEAATVLARFIHLSARPVVEEWAQTASAAIRLLNDPAGLAAAPSTPENADGLKGDR